MTREHKEKALRNAESHLAHCRAEVTAAQNAMDCGKISMEEFWAVMEVKQRAWEIFFDAYEAVTGRQPREACGVSAV